MGFMDTLKKMFGGSEAPAEPTPAPAEPMAESQPAAEAPAETPTDQSMQQ